MINSTVKNPQMLALARDEGEPAFIEAINSSVYKPVIIAQASEEDDKACHFDIKMLEYDAELESYAWHFVDVKDVEEKNFSTGNYVLRKPFIEFHTELRPHGYYIALRLVEDNKRTSKFMLASTQEVLKKCKLINMGSYALLPLSEVKSKCACRLVQEEAI